MSTLPLVLCMATVLAALPNLGPVYIVCLIVGGGLLVVSTVLSGHGHGDVDGASASLDSAGGLDAHVEPGADFADHAGPETDTSVEPVHHAGGLLDLSKWFSIRFLVYFLAGFGLVGTVLRYASNLGWWATLGWAIVCGLIIGQAVHQMISYLRRTSGGGELAAADFVQKPARVTVSIAPQGCGEVAAHIRGEERFVPARAQRDDDRFSVGDTVVIMGLEAGVARVVSRREFDFLNESSKGGQS